MTELLTERLSLRQVGPGDYAAVTQLYARPRVMEHIQPGGRTPQQTADFLERAEKLWRERNFGFMVVRELGKEALVGVSGLLQRQPGGPVEVGYAFDEPYWGKGYATEATARVLRWAFEEHKLERVIALVVPGNLASVRVLEKVGMTPDGSLPDGALRYEIKKRQP